MGGNTQAWLEQSKGILLFEKKSIIVLYKNGDIL